jgi:hypothetical protein
MVIVIYVPLEKVGFLKYSMGLGLRVQSWGIV